MSQTEMRACFKGAKLVDYTGRHIGFTQLQRFGTEFIELVREGKGGAKAVVVIDSCAGAAAGSPLLVRDHINLTGDNPLVGPNNPIGERFPVVQGIYFSDLPGGLRTGVVAGLAEGVLPDTEDTKRLKEIGADICSYNMVQSMLVAAHAGWKVLGIIVPERGELAAEQIKEIRDLVEGN